MDLNSILPIVGAVVGGANLLTAATPTQIDNKYKNKARGVINILLRILNVLAVNIGANKNKDDK